MARTVLRVDDATNEGSRALRELLRRLTLGQLSKRLRCTPSTVRKWAKEMRTPTAAWRERMFLELGIPLGAWERRPTNESPVIHEAAAIRADVRDGVTHPTPSRKESTLCPDSDEKRNQITTK